MNINNNVDTSNGSSTPLWKEKSFVLWAVPLVGSLLAVFLDIGYLLYFDIPIMYAEINLYSASIISLFLIAVIIGIITILIIAFKISESKFIILKVFFQPGAIAICLVLALVATLSDQNKTLIYVFYVLLVVMPVLSALFDRSGGKGFIDRLDKEVDNPFGSSSSNKKMSSRIETLGANVFLIFIIVLIVLSASTFVAKKSNVWVLEDDVSTVVIKRNNDLYILKSFDPKTNILNEGFQLKKLGELPLKLTPMHPKIELKTAIKAKFEASQNEERLKQEKKVYEFIKDVKSFMHQ